MIVCNRHPRCYVEKHCELQQRAADAAIEAQRQGDEVLVVLVDREDRGHAALAVLGTSAAYHAAAKFATELGMRT